MAVCDPVNLIIAVEFIKEDDEKKLNGSFGRITTAVIDISLARFT